MPRTLGNVRVFLSVLRGMDGSILQGGQHTGQTVLLSVGCGRWDDMSVVFVVVSHMERIALCYGG